MADEKTTIYQVDCFSMQLKTTSEYLSYLNADQGVIYVHIRLAVCLVNYGRLARNDGVLGGELLGEKMVMRGLIIIGRGNVAGDDGGRLESRQMQISVDIVGYSSAGPV